MSSPDYDDYMTLKLPETMSLPYALCMSCVSDLPLSLAPLVTAACTLRVIRVVSAPVSGAPHHCCTPSARDTCGLLVPAISVPFHRPRSRRTTRSAGRMTSTPGRMSTTGSSRCLPSTKCNPCTTGTGLSERSTFTKRSSPHPRLPSRWLMRGEQTGGDNLQLNKEEDEAVAYEGVQDLDAEPENKRETADPREPAPSRGEPLLTQKVRKPMWPQMVKQGAGMFRHGAIASVIPVLHVRL